MNDDDQTSKADDDRPMHSNTKPSEKRGRPSPSLGRDVQAKIGQQLRAYYDGLIEPTPDRFADLLSKLDGKPNDKGSAE